MKKEMKFAYVSPVMERTQIETESTFAGSVVDEKPATKETSVSAHETGFEHDFTKVDPEKPDNITWE